MSEEQPTFQATRPLSAPVPDPLDEPATELVARPGQAPAVRPVTEPVTEPIPAVGGVPHISLGPYSQQSAALAAGNLGMNNGLWEDYDTQGRPGAWFIVPTKD